MSVAAVLTSVTPVPSPSLVPSVSPVVHVVSQTVVHASILDSLNSLAVYAPAASTVVLAGILANAIQTQVNKLPWLTHDIARVQDIRRFIASGVIPTLTVGLAGLSQGQNALHLAPFAWFAAQTSFYVVKLLKGEPVPNTPITTPLATEEVPATQG